MWYVVLSVVLLPVAITLGGVIADLLFVRRRTPLTVLLAGPMLLVAASSFAGSAVDQHWTRWTAAVWLAFATFLGPPDDNRHPQRLREGRREALAVAVLVAAAACNVWGLAFETGGLPLAGVLALGGSGLVATRQRAREQFDPSHGPGAHVGAAICFVLAVSFAASAAVDPGTAVFAVASALVVAAVHLTGAWGRATPYPWTDVAGVAGLVALVTVAGI